MELLALLFIDIYSQVCMNRYYERNVGKYTSYQILIHETDLSFKTSYEYKDGKIYLLKIRPNFTLVLDPKGNEIVEVRK